MLQYFKKNSGFIFLMAVLCVLLFVPNAKALLLKGLLHTGVFNASTKKELSTASSTGIASLSFIDNNGSRLTVADLKGKVIFINFWATWCPPCIAEMASINSLYNQLKTDTRIVFVAADADNNLPLSTAFMQKHQYNLPVYEIAGPVPADLFSGTLPTTLIIDASGNLVKKHEGIANYDTAAMISFLKGL